MKVIQTRNAHRALVLGIDLLSKHGIRRESRNGPVLQMPTPVTTVYEKPLERVVFWPERDANPFFHLYEALWMLAGRWDVAGVARFAKRMETFSDNGVNLHGAYGARWRGWFTRPEDGVIIDQLELIAEALKANRDDRRQVLQMWDCMEDLGRNGKDVPCNLECTFQINTEGALDLVVFCRSNDIVWGAYGANAVHFSFLLEYMALWVGVPVGRYYQVSVNWHGYLSTFEPLENLPKMLDEGYSQPIDWARRDPYTEREVNPLRLSGDIKLVDEAIEYLLRQADQGFPERTCDTRSRYDYGWSWTVWCIFAAHHQWRTMEPPDRFDKALAVLDLADKGCDFVLACKQWITRRRRSWEAKILSGAAGR